MGWPVTREPALPWNRAGTRLEAGGIPVPYQRINIELIVVAYDADAVAA
jgi:hypothetical protein